MLGVVLWLGGVCILCFRFNVCCLRAAFDFARFFGVVGYGLLIAGFFCMLLDLLFVLFDSW